MKYIITSLLLIIGCSKKDVLPYQFVGITCLEHETNCIEIEKIKILKEPIIKTKIKKTVLQLDGFSVVYENDTHENLNKMIKDFPHREYVHVLNNKIFYRSIEHTDFPFKFSVKTDLKQGENFKKCIEFSNKCDKQEFELQIKMQETLNSKLSVIKNREKTAKKINESLRWLPTLEQLFIYDKAGKKIKTINPRTITLQQEFDESKNEFIHENKMIKFNFGWVRRSDLAPENIFINSNNVFSELSKLHYELKCLNQKNLELHKQDFHLVKSFIKAQIRSLEVAYNALNSKPLAGYDKLKTALKDYKCPL